MTATISAFKNVPDFAKGYVRDLRVRWALEEAGLPYDQKLVDGESKNSAEYRAWQPFGQVPAFRDANVTLFESGAIVLYIAERSEALSPRDEQGRMRVATWILAALNSVEPSIDVLALADIFLAREPWAKDLRGHAVKLLDGRLNALGDWLGDKEYLEDRFTAGDLMMATVLRNIPDGDVASHPTVKAYRERCLARPAFGRALAAQLAAFELAQAA